MITFSEQYPLVRVQCSCAREERENIREHVLQHVWHAQRFEAEGLCSLEGHRLKVIAPGWWNRQAGPDFKRAQIEFNGKAYSGDVEIHFEPGAWQEHGHHLDPRYEEVILHVVLDGKQHGSVKTFSGREVPTVVLRPQLREALENLASELSYEPPVREPLAGSCAALIPSYGTAALENFLRLAGEWRLLSKMRQLRERMDQVGQDQAVYEAFMYACGFGHFKQHFGAIARHLPYDRARQLAKQDPLLLEAAFLQLAGLLPDTLPEGTTAVPHFARLRALRHEKLPRLRSLPLEWKRVGVRPANYPERRLAGASLFVARTAQQGLVRALMNLWREDLPALALRRQMERMFPAAMGFWATHCSWTGKRLQRPAAPLGPGRVRSIIGNVFVPAGLALAREARDLQMEERVFAFFCKLPAEPDNSVVQTMLPRVLGNEAELKLNFRLQQGLLQMYYDWCEPNPSCQNCGLLRYLEREAGKTEKPFSPRMNTDEHG